MAISQHRAKELVRQIAKDHGHLGEEVYARMDANTRREVEEALLKKDEMIGSTVITLAKNLYSKDVRFIFELLQNADDNHFGRAKAANTDAYVSFRVYRDKIIVECNEDGFTEGNLRAICNVGKSSKLGAQGYIGEKGIGFKSVFKVAWKVWIQSGSFSFSFKHRRGDSGMGMISPEWQDTAEVLRTPLTRMTFYLHDEGDSTARAEQRKNIEDQLRDLKPEMLLFLKKLRKINVHFYGQNGQVVSSSTLSQSPGRDNRSMLHIRTVERGKGPTDTYQQYYVSHYQANGLPPNENREYSSEEHTAAAYSRADIVLAFPLSDPSTPKITPQEVYAFLPIRRFGFNFLIHSDFVTQANREDIVTSSPRNRKLCVQLADAFVSTIKRICDEHDPLKLRFTWMRYLPSLTGGPSHDPFWSMFIDALKENLANESVLLSRTSSNLRRITRHKRLTQEMLDGNRQPLLMDLDPPDNIYPSSGYADTDLSILGGYGLDRMSLAHVVTRIEADLARRSSRILAPGTDDDWHRRVASLLIKPFKQRSEQDLIPQIKRLRLLPLSNGSWVAANNNVVHFPTTADGFAIPSGSDLQLIDPKAAAHPQRNELFRALGVTALTSDAVRSHILAMLRKSFWHHSISVTSAVVLLQFLYITHPVGAAAQTYNGIGIYCSPNTASTNLADVYFGDDDFEYGPTKLGSGLSAAYLHADYLKNSPIRTEETSRPGDGWRQWLHKSIGIRKQLRLVSPDGDSLSENVRYVAEHMPEKFLGLLHSLWPEQGSQVISNTGIMQSLMQTKALCEGGRRELLEATILPIPRLKQLAGKYMRQVDLLPFLKLQTALEDENLRGWDFLDRFQVTRRDDLRFYLTILRVLSEYANGSGGIHSVHPGRLCELYVDIHAKCISSMNRQQDQETVRDVARKAPGVIFVPMKTRHRNQQWHILGDSLLLGAPADMRHKIPLDTLYMEKYSGAEMFDMQSITGFFRDTLAIPQHTWQDILGELRYLKRERCQDAEHVRLQYERLRDAALDDAAAAELRQLSNSEELVFASVGGQTRTWRKAADCLWSSAARGVRGKPNLATQYDEKLENFFVFQLGVQRLNLTMVIDDLMSLHTSTTTVAEVKNQLYSLDELLKAEAPPEPRTVARLLKRRIFPVQYPTGEVHLCNAETEFAVVDRHQLETMFRGKVKMLDFSMSEVHALKRFIHWIGLDTRFLSRMLVEKASLRSGEKFPVSEPRYDIRVKAHGLTRIAAAFHSPRFERNPQRLYDLFRGSETWETDGISSKLTLSMDGRDFTVVQEQSEVYIDDNTDSGIKIYIPHDEEALDVCIQHALPQKLVQWLMEGTDAGTEVIADGGSSQPNPAALGVIAALLNARIGSVSRILEKYGIIDIDVPNEDNTVFGAVCAPNSLTTTLIGTSELGDSATDTEDDVVFTPAVSTTASTTPYTVNTPRTYPLPFRFPSPAVRDTTPTRDYVSESRLNGEAYRRVLGHVVSAARRIRFPSLGSDTSPLKGAITELDYASRNSFWDPDMPQNRDIKIGAAGELFVFELLSVVGDVVVPDFSRHNWRSNIRHLVNVHPEYESISNWNGQEISDIIYQDASGRLTGMLIDKGYLSAERWGGRQPTYYFEVKTTVNGWDAPFYMSGQQYDKMRECTQENSIYIIFRVFNLLTDGVDVKLYVDPLDLQRRKQLRFSTEGKFTVTAAS